MQQSWVSGLRIFFVICLTGKSVLIRINNSLTLDLQFNNALPEGFVPLILYSALIKCTFHRLSAYD